MSQSPSRADGEATEYFAAFETLNRLLWQGQSFSGREPDCVFLNTGRAPFADVSAATSLDLRGDGRALSAIDWDFDGDLDLWQANRSAPSLHFMRNDLPRASHFLALRLAGRRSNRDAVGARIELTLATSPPRRLVKTVTAGDGYLSQASRWVHFGLGSSSDIAKLEVRWPGGAPGGAVEEFQGLKADAFFRLAEGEGRAVIWQPPRAARAAASSSPAAAAAAAVASTERVVLYRPREIGDAGVLALGGAPSTLRALGGGPGPMLVNLWATWCAPCAQELRDFTRNASRLQAAGLAVVALSVDGIKDDEAEPDAKVQSYLEGLGFPFPAGRTSRELLLTLDELQGSITYLERPLVLPSSFLLDRHGRVAVLYRGPVLAEQVLADLQLLGAEGADTNETARPFQGRRLEGEVFSTDPLSYARALLRGGEPGAARGWLERYLVAHPDGATATDPTERERQQRGFAQVHFMLGDLLAGEGRRAEATTAFRRSVQFDPGQPWTHLRLAELLGDGDGADAVEGQLREVLRLAPQSAELLSAVGNERLKQGQIDQADELCHRALAVAPTAPATLLLKAMIAERRGETEAAVLAYGEVLRRDPGNHRAVLNLVLLHAVGRDAARRDHGAALRLCETARGQEPECLAALAAAYGGSGQREHALDTLARAIELASRTRGPEVVEGLERQRARLAAGG